MDAVFLFVFNFSMDRKPISLIFLANVAYILPGNRQRGKINKYHLLKIINAWESDVTSTHRHMHRNAYIIFFEM